MSGRRAIALLVLGGTGLAALLFALLDLERERAWRPVCRLAVTAFAAPAQAAEPAEAAGLADGLAAALATQLSGIRGIDAAGPAELAAGDRGPFTLRLAGRLRAAAPRLQVEVAWIDGASGRVRRALLLSAGRGRLPELQERLALATAAECGIRPSFAERRALARGLAGSLPAYELYLRARALLDRDAGAPERHDAAARLLRQATALDPGFALAHAALAEALLREGLVTKERRAEALSIKERSAEALREAELARELDDHLPAIHLALVRADRAAGRQRAARVELLRLLSLRPEIADARRELR
jgi:hypothetical protein